MFCRDIPTDVVGAIWSTPSPLGVAIVPAKIQETRINLKPSIALLDPLKAVLEVGIAAEGLARHEFLVY